MITLEEIRNILINAPLSFTDYEIELLAEYIFESLNNKYI